MKAKIRACVKFPPYIIENTFEVKEVLYKKDGETDFSTCLVYYDDKLYKWFEFNDSVTILELIGDKFELMSG